MLQHKYPLDFDIDTLILELELNTDDPTIKRRIPAKDRHFHTEYLRLAKYHELFSEDDVNALRSQLRLI